MEDRITKEAALYFNLPEDKITESHRRFYKILIFPFMHSNGKISFSESLNGKA